MPLSKCFLDLSNEALRPVLDRLRPPVCYVKFDVTFRIARPARTIGLDGRFRPSAAPLRVPRTYPHPIAHFPDSERSVCVLGLFSHTCLWVYLCLGLSLHAVLFAESPRSARPLRPRINNS